MHRGDGRLCRATFACNIAPGHARFFYLVLVASVMGLLFRNAGMQAVGPARGVLFINLVPVTAFTIAVMGGRVPSGAELAGVALVVVALVLNSLAQKAPAPVTLSLSARGAG